jgi:hypothetical protein
MKHKLKIEKRSSPGIPLKRSVGHGVKKVGPKKALRLGTNSGGTSNLLAVNRNGK